MSKKILSALVFSIVCQTAIAKEKIHAFYIPLADHYPAIIAYEKYRDKMKEADFTIQKQESWPSLQGQFNAKKADIAFITSPIAMDMFTKNPNFRWISLIHRNGNALAINKEMEKFVNLAENRRDRKPTAQVAEAFVKAKESLKSPSIVAVPSLLATHVLILYKFLKDNGKTLGIGQKNKNVDVMAIAVPPPKSPDFLKLQDEQSHPASFEQSLPWADVVETGGFGKVAWYSKDVLPWPNGHVECLVIAQDESIKNKQAAVKEVIQYIHQAGMDIHNAQQSGEVELAKIADLIHKHIPIHSKEAIIQSLNKDLDVINYINLNIDQGGLKQVMDLAIESGVLTQAIDINTFADEQFATQLTVHNIESKD
jgi:NitT/TauT family transport system substrate-binding protein